MTDTTYTLTHANAPLLAYIFDGLCRINMLVRHDRMEVRKESFTEEIGTSEDRLLSAAIMIAAEAVKHLQPALDFYIQQNQPGVFVYDCLDFSEDAGVANCVSLPAFLWRELAKEPSYWLAVAEHLRVEDVPIVRFINEWRELVDLI